MAPFDLTPPRKPRAHALSLAESLLGPRTRTFDADRVGLDPLLRSHLNSMSEGIDGLLRRAEPVPTLYDAQNQAGKLQRGAQELQQSSSPVRLANLPPGAPPDGLLHTLISGLANEDVSVSDAVGTLESDLRSPTPLMTAPGRLGWQADADSKASASPWKGHTLVECDRCSVMALQVRALAQSLAGLSAKVFNWSSDLKPAQRRQLSDLVLQYTLPCAHIDESIQHLCDELSSTRWDNTHQADETKKRRASRSSATWHWWDSDPANLGLTSNKAEASAPDPAADDRSESPGRSKSPAADPKDKAGIKTIRLIEPSGKEIPLDGGPGTFPPDLSSIQHVSSPKAALDSKSTSSLTAHEKIIVNVSGLEGVTGALQLQLVLFDKAGDEDEDGVVAASSKVQVKKNQVTSVDMFPDMTVEQNGLSYYDMEDPCFGLALDQAVSTALELDDESKAIEVDLGQSVDIAVKKKKKGGFWSRK